VDGGNDACQGSTCSSLPDGPCACAAPGPESANFPCADGTTGGPLCETHRDGTCDWVIRTCTTACPGLGCAPACLNGVVKDGNGCDTCSCAPSPDAGPAPSTCTTNADCGAGGLCGYASLSACAATGTCFATSGPVCDLFSPGCGCDGTEIDVACTGLPSGYVSKPLLHTGVCTDAGAPDGGTSDAGPSDAGSDCCPTGWGLHACKQPDGGAGMACHNPQLGCASSATCGEGCDRVVTGRCGS
jgi:hypothetical protein